MKLRFKLDSRLSKLDPVVDEGNEDAEGSLSASRWTYVDAASLQPEYVRKAVAMASFYLARCLEKGIGIERNKVKADQLFSKVNRPIFSLGSQSSCQCLKLI